MRPGWEWRGVAGIVGAVGLLICSLSSGVWAQERPQGEAAHDQWLFAPGRVELGLQVGGGFSFAQGERDASLFTLLPRIGYVFSQQRRFLPGSLEFVAEPTYLAVFEHQTAHVGGLAALLKYNFWTGNRWTPYLAGGAGVSYASHRVPHKGTNFNFMTEVGLGLHYTVGTRSTLNLEWRYHHFSNADIAPPNPSLNSSLFLIGFSVLY